MERLISWAEVEAAVPYSRVHIWRLIRNGEFPAPVNLGPRRVAFRESELAKWLESRQTVEYANAGWKRQPEKVGG
jgi:prophage regulatory protein